MHGLLMLTDAHPAQMHPETLLRDSQKLHIKILWENAAENLAPPLFLSRVQLQFARLKRHCSWCSIMAEGDCAAYAFIIAAQLPVDRLIIIGDKLFQSRHPDRRMRRLNAFARRNLSLVNAEIIASGMDARSLRMLASSLSWCSGGLLHIPDAAELWQKRETFLTLSFEAFSSPPQHAK